MENKPMADTTNSTILVLDDDAAFRDRLARALSARHYQVLTAADASEALRAVKHHGPDLILLDLRLGTESGLDVLPALRAANPAGCMIMLTGYGSIATAVKAVQAGAADYLTKPVTVEQILNCWQRLKAGNSTSPLATDCTPSLDEIQWDHIQRVLSDCGGNISQAAEALGLHRRSLQRKLAKRPFRHP
jgi:two-component system response regulator RegA